MVSASSTGEGAAAPEAEPSLTAAALLAWRREMLSLPGIGTASAAELDWLLDLAGGLGWSLLQGLWLHPQRRVSLARPLPELEALWRRHRTSAEPLQYLVGCCPWRDLELAVAPGVLIPRQETEQLIEVALQLLPPPSAATPLCWADLGTGSGCLALALARALPGSQGLAVDASSEALRQASANLNALLPPGSCLEGTGDAHGSEPRSPCGDALTTSVRLQQGHWWEAIEPWWGRLGLVVSNPPYIPTAVLAELDPGVRDHEPALALDGGTDGLDAIRVIVAGAPEALAAGGVLLLEHHHDQSDAVLTLLAAAGLRDCRAHRDLEGVRRFASARWEPCGGSSSPDAAPPEPAERPRP